VDTPGPREGLVRVGKHLLRAFPQLRQTPWAVTSPRTPLYNCIAWAAGDDRHWWEPDAAREYRWPPGVPREYRIEAYIAAFEFLGYDVCEVADEALDPGHEKVAIYAKDGEVTHAARQLQTGEWTSKCGELEDITHALGGLEGPHYGTPVVIMRRRLARSTQDTSPKVEAD